MVGGINREKARAVELHNLAFSKLKPRESQERNAISHEDTSANKSKFTTWWYWCGFWMLKSYFFFNKWIYSPRRQNEKAFPLRTHGGMVRVEISLPIMLINSRWHFDSISLLQIGGFSLAVDAKTVNGADAGSTTDVSSTLGQQRRIVNLLELIVADNRKRRDLMFFCAPEVLSSSSPRYHKQNDIFSMGIAFATILGAYHGG